MCVEFELSSAQWRFALLLLTEKYQFKWRTMQIVKRNTHKSCLHIITLYSNIPDKSV